MTPDLLLNGPKEAEVTIALAHGAGAGMTTPFMDAIAAGLAEQFRVARFEFPYMAKSQKTGMKKPPDRLPVLQKTWKQVIQHLGTEGLIIGGKSMGGRIASLIADESEVPGLVCLGYPFHPVGKPEQLRIEHLREIKTPTLILQGERDPFGNLEEVKNYELSNAIQIEWLPDGDHSFKPRKKSGHTEEQNQKDAIEAIARFVENL